MKKLGLIIAMIFVSIQILSANNHIKIKQNQIKQIKNNLQMPKHLSKSIFLAICQIFSKKLKMNSKY